MLWTAYHRLAVSEWRVTRPERFDEVPILQKILALLKARPDVKLEVQGHTDNVGGDDYNQKLSDSRATAVVEWLRTKGIAADSPDGTRIRSEGSYRVCH